MTPTQRKAMEQALEFIENHSKHWNGTGIHPQTTVIDLRAALAEPTYPLPDDLYPGSKDWVQGNYAERVEWLHTMYESAKRLNAALAEQPAEQVGDEFVGCLEYRGNSVAYIFQKLTAYRSVIDDAWQAMRESGHPPDGKTNLAEAIKQATKAPQPAKRVPLTDDEALKIWSPEPSRPVMGRNKVLAFARAVERAHGITGDAE